MPTAPTVLLEGRPGVGKTTVASRLVELLRASGVPVAGFLTREIRERGRRVGFSLETLDGQRGVLAHADRPGRPRVGRYGVDLAGFERLALPALESAAEVGVAVVDELGKMELYSEAFRDGFTALLKRRVPLVATVLASRHPYTDDLKRRPDVETIRVTPSTRDELPGRLAARLRGG
jgi:nucleoside-triphosphatase